MFIKTFLTNSYSICSLTGGSRCLQNIGSRCTANTLEQYLREGRMHCSFVYELHTGKVIESDRRFTRNGPKLSRKAPESSSDKSTRGHHDKKRAILLTIALLLLLLPASFIIGQEPSASNNYPLTSDSLPHTGIPHGEVFHFELTHSAIFADTHRTIFVYIPAEYKAETPACVYVGLDGLSFNVPVVFDNLIAKHEMPITIAIGISSGIVDSADGTTDPRFDRSFEFDSRNDRLVRFIVQEVFPEVEHHLTQDGRKIVLSKNASDHMIAGGSTGGIGAFTVAWERPDQFQRVFTAIGTFVGMRGGEGYYVEVRKTEPKPIRIFMQDGSHDEWWGGPEMGDWWMSNQTMERALSFAGYEVEHAWGLGTHDGSQAAAVFPDAMRWLWQGWPKPVQVGVSANPVLRSVLEDDSSWELIGQVCSSTADITTGIDGKVYQWNAASRRVQEVSNKQRSPACLELTNEKHVSIASGPDGHFYIADYARNEIAMTSLHQQHPKIILSDMPVKGLTVRDNGDLYITTESKGQGGEVWRIQRNGRKELLASGLKGVEGISFSPDGLWLFVAQAQSRSSFSYRVKKDGSLDAGEPFYNLYVPTWADSSGANSVWMDTNGLAYVATSAGVQIMDRNGRVAAILPLPRNRPATGLCFAGDGFHTLYVSSGGRIYARKVKATGSAPWGGVVQLPKGSAG